MTLGANCKHLQEFTIPAMKPDVFMSDTALFHCFFSGLTPEKVLECHRTKVNPKLSFPNLKYVDILYCKQMQRFIQMLCFYYPKVGLSGIDLSIDEDNKYMLKPFNDVGASMNSIAVFARTRTILDEKLNSLVKNAPYLREMRMHVDDNFPGADVDAMYRRRLDEAGLKLKNLIEKMKNMESLVIKPHEGTDVTKVVLPSIAHHGKYLRSLYLVYDFSMLNSNVLYQLVNQCPQLNRLVVSLCAEEFDVASKNFK